MNDPRDVVLYSLQLVDDAEWSAVEHSVAAVDPGYNGQTASSKRLGLTWIIYLDNWVRSGNVFVLQNCSNTLCCLSLCI